MKKNLSFLFAVTTIAISSNVQAALFTPKFDTPVFPGSNNTYAQFNVDAAHNDYYATHYGINVSNVYLYKDPRDIFDNTGVANGLISANYQPNQTGRIDFLDTTSFVNIDYLAILKTTYQAFSKTGQELSSFTADPSTGTFSLSGGIISYVLFSSTGGYGTVSGLTYSYDGTTDGQNTDINTDINPDPKTYVNTTPLNQAPDISAVPIPAAIWLFGSGLALLTGVSRRKTAKCEVLAN
jgi:hypothetical protein